jgi:hypothetical protein
MLSRLVRQYDTGFYCGQLIGKNVAQIWRLEPPFAPALHYDDLRQFRHLMQAAKQPNQKNDRDWDSEQP